MIALAASTAGTGGIDGQPGAEPGAAQPAATPADAAGDAGAAGGGPGRAEGGRREPVGAASRRWWRPGRRHGRAGRGRGRAGGRRPGRRRAGRCRRRRSSRRRSCRCSRAACSWPWRPGRWTRRRRGAAPGGGAVGGRPADVAVAVEDGAGAPRLGAGRVIGGTPRWAVVPGRTCQVGLVGGDAGAGADQVGRAARSSDLAARRSQLGEVVPCAAARQVPGGGLGGVRLQRGRAARRARPAPWRRRPAPASAPGRRRRAGAR